MKKLIITLLLIFTPLFAFAEYISPESYAVNEADLTDYRYIPPSPKLDIDTLESMKNSNNLKKESNKNISVKTKKVKKQKLSKNADPEAYKKKLSYKIAKWWVDKRYEREEPHHGTKHEIKIKARENYEKKLEEKLNENQ